MTGASMFWLDTLQGYNLDRSLSLPFDRYRSANEHQTGCGISISFDFGEHISRHFLSYASSNDIAPIHMVLTCYYVFLFKLTNGEKDLCIGMNTDGRFKEELMSIIGIFINAIPLRCQLDSHWSFHQLTKSVAEMLINSMKYSYFPLQHILAQHPNASKSTFLDTSFDFYSIDDDIANNDIIIGDNRLHGRP